MTDPHGIRKGSPVPTGDPNQLSSFLQEGNPQELNLQMDTTQSRAQQEQKSQPGSCWWGLGHRLGAPLRGGLGAGKGGQVGPLLRADSKVHRPSEQVTRGEEPTDTARV